jgi:hypothetical protein
MPSPFPGMNPFLEQDDTWEDFHASFISRAQEVLNQSAGVQYSVRVRVQRYRHELTANVTHPIERGAAEPVRLSLPAVDVERHSSLEIIDRRARRVVTVLELLSPSNKARGADRNDYLGKRSQVLARQVHLVEIDLCRGGERPRPPDLPPCDYYALVSRSEDRPDLDMWPISLRDPLPTIPVPLSPLSLRDPLPTIPVPLSPPDPDVHLDLQALLHRVYDAADYGKYIYGETPQPPLTPADDAWAQQFLPRRPDTGNPT